MELSGSRKFDKVKLSRTDVKLLHRPSSLCCTMFQTASEVLNHPELIYIYADEILYVVLLYKLFLSFM